MKIESRKLESISLSFATDVYHYLQSWMKECHAENADFHRFRMRLLCSINDHEKTVDKLLSLVEKVNSKNGFDIYEVISDKIMGESIAKYILSCIMLRLNDEYLKTLDHEIDRVTVENNILNKRHSELKIKIGQH